MPNSRTVSAANRCACGLGSIPSAVKSFFGRIDRFEQLIGCHFELDFNYEFN